MLVYTIINTKRIMQAKWSNSEMIFLKGVSLPSFIFQRCPSKIWSTKLREMLEGDLVLYLPKTSRAKSRGKISCIICPLHAHSLNMIDLLFTSLCGVLIKSEPTESSASSSVDIPSYWDKGAPDSGTYKVHSPVQACEVVGESLYLGL